MKFPLVRRKTLEKARALNLGQQRELERLEALLAESANRADLIHAEANRERTARLETESEAEKLLQEVEAKDRLIDSVLKLRSNSGVNTLFVQLGIPAEAVNKLRTTTSDVRERFVFEIARRLVARHLRQVFVSIEKSTSTP